VSKKGNVYQDRNASIQFRVIDALAGRAPVALHKFFRQLDLDHVYWELVAPTLEKKSSIVVAAVREASWPPKGVEARAGKQIQALSLVHPLGETSASLSGVMTSYEDMGNINLAAALYRETLEEMIKRRVKEVSYVVLEGAVLCDRVLRTAAFEKSEDLFLTEDARYILYRADPKRHLKSLNLDDGGTKDLLLQDLSDKILERYGLFHGAISLATFPFWRGRPGAEMAVNTGGGLDAAQPGGVLS
jgi:hypothetical protein